ncbi:MAG: hydroxyethylthiazole kinase [Clostridium sartagoforme]|nr:hydroxyethylthiazole kinase [Clostridium sartagoforme]
MQIGIRALDDTLNLQKNKQPLIHCISNPSEELKKSIINYYGRYIFSSSLEEYKELTSKACSLLISLKDLNEDKIVAIEQSIRVARRIKIPIVLDILGVDTSFSIKEIALRFINRYDINVVIGKVEEFKSIVLNKKSVEKEKNIKYKLVEDKALEISLREFSRIYRTFIVVKSDDYYLTDGFSKFYIKRYVNKEKKLVGIEEILSGLISIGVASASNTEESFMCVLVAIMTMAVSEKKAEQKILNYGENIVLKNYLADEVKNINANELNILSKINYIFTR